MSTSGNSISRRGLLAAAGGIGAVALGGGLLSGCNGGSGSGKSGGSNGGNANKVAPPTYVPFTGGTPDIKGDPTKGIDDAYFSYPTADKQVQTVNGPVGSGGPFKTFVITYSPPPVGLDQNTYWQSINKALNVQYSSNLVPDEFDTKLAAMLTANDLPDLVTSHVSSAWGLRGYESVVKDKFADLSEHLSGDAAKEYPNLARLLPETWDPTFVDGKIYATPTRRIQTSSAVFLRADKISQYGGNPKPTNADEFVAMCKAVSSPGDKRYALANEGTWLSPLFYPMFGVPNGWRKNDDGTLVNAIETPEWQEAIRFIASTWKQGFWHPDSPSGTATKMEPFFANGSVMTRSDNFVRYTVRGQLNFAVELMEPFLAKGGPAPQFISQACDFLTFVKKGSPERVKESLRILNFLSAPLGSKENFLRTYGVEGTHHTIVDGKPKLTEKGTSETTALSLRFIAGGPDVLFASNGDAHIVKKMNAYQVAVAERRLANPVATVYAESAARTSKITQQVTDTINDVVIGRKPESALNDVVAAWKKGGGDKLREEYQEALAKK